jgi:hypothetical protein
MKDRTDRRTFLSLVGAATTIGALSLVTGGRVLAQSVDSDRETSDTRLPPTIRDEDAGSNADRVGCCRGSRMTDDDTGVAADPVVERHRSGITDADTGADADPAYHGRGTTEQVEESP